MSMNGPKPDWKDDILTHKKQSNDPFTSGYLWYQISQHWNVCLLFCLMLAIHSSVVKTVGFEVCFFCYKMKTVWTIFKTLIVISTLHAMIWIASLYTISFFLISFLLLLFQSITKHERRPEKRHSQLPVHKLKL
jgi:hypothetical protein